MLPEYKPILVDTPREFGGIELYFIHDLHRSDPLFNKGKYERLKQYILEKPERQVCWLGDIMNGAIPGGKTEMFGQTMTPQQEKEWFAEELRQFGSKTLCVIDGNHEYNRLTRAAGIYPLYDACAIAGVEDRYRSTYAIVDIGVGVRDKDPKQQVHYAGFCIHRSRELKMFGMADWIEGIDFMAYGHDHSPKSRPAAKLVYDTKRKTFARKNIEVINSGSFLEWGGYAAQGAMRPGSDAMWKLCLSGGKKQMCTASFYV